MPRTRILAIDDQLYFRVYLEDLLDQEGYEVTTVSSAEEALVEAEARSFDVILTDLAIPGAEGAELVRRLRERAPETAIVVLTGVGDVHVAVEAMKVGATDYLLKPIDRAVLAHTLNEILQQRQMRAEHASLLAENLEFMGAVSLYERALGLYIELSPERLSDRIVEGLCLETHAHGGVLWMARAGDPRRLRLQGARGLVRVEEERSELDLDDLPEALAPLAQASAKPFEAAAAGTDGAPGSAALYVPLTADERLLGVVRVTDKVDGDAFDELDRAAAAKFAGFAARATANALEMRALERRSFRDPLTKAYTRAYFDDVARNELQKANRFGRLFSFLVVELSHASGARAERSEPERARWLEGVAFQIGRCLRATDLLATDLTADSEGRFCMLLPETDAMGAAILKRRLRSALDRSDEIQDLAAESRPQVSVASATHPADGTDLEAIWRVLELRLEEDRQSAVRRLGLAASGFGDTLDRLLGESQPGRPETVEQVTRFLLSEIARRPHERGVFFVAPGPQLQAALRAGLDELRGLEPRTEIVVLDDKPDAGYPGLPLTWIDPGRVGHPPPFLVRFGEGVPFALVRQEAISEDVAGIYQSSDRALVEQLAFQLGADLGIPMGE